MRVKLRTRFKMDWIRHALADRIGGASFDETTAYKFAEIKRLKQNFLKRFPGRILLDMGVGEPDEAAPQCVIRTLRDECEKSENRFYADSGTFYFRKAVAEYMRSLFGVDLNPATEILHSMGIKAALSIFAGCLVNPGDLVLVTVPGYAVFSLNACYFGATIYPLPLKEANGFFPDFEGVPKAILKKAKVCVLNYPNNPTGVKGSYAFFEKTIQLATEYQWVVIQDAAYAPLAFDDRPISLLQVPGAKAVSVELHSMSKGFNMTGWRIGWVCGNELLVRAYEKYKNTVDSGQFLAIQKAAAEGLKQAPILLRQNVEKYRRRCEGVLRVLEKLGIKYRQPEAGFFIYVDMPQRVVLKTEKIYIDFAKASEFSNWLLNETGVIVIPWDEAGHFVRFSLTFEAADVAAEVSFMQRLEERLSCYQFCYTS